MVTIRSPKRLFELELHCTESQKACMIDTAVETLQRTVFFHHK
jgi:hypothetical protein